MVKPKLLDIMIIVLIVCVVILASSLVVGLNNMAARAQGGEPAVGLDTAHGASPEGGERDTTGSLAGGDLEGLGPYLSSDPRGAIGVQSTGSGVEYVPSAAFRYGSVAQSPILGGANGFVFWPTSGYVWNDSSNLLCVDAPVYVPHGTTITRLTMFFVDDHPTEDMWRAFLVRSKHASPPVGGETDTVIDLDFLDGSGIDDSVPFFAFSTIIVTPGSQIVTNEYAYTLAFCFAPNSSLDHLLYGFSVEYE